jgi:GTP-binding protein HflX
MVFNKIDRLKNGEAVGRFLEQYPNSVAVSAVTGEGFPALSAELGSQLRPSREFVELNVPHSEPAVIARLHAVGQVVERDYNGDSARFKARIPPHFHAEFAPFIVQDLKVA